MTTCVTVGATPGCVNLQIVRGDVVALTFRWKDDEEAVIDTSTMAARAQIRKKAAVAGEYPIICTMATDPEAGQGEITLGVVGDEPDPGDPDLRTNISVVIAATITEDFPATTRPTRAEWAWDLEIWDPTDLDNTRRTIMAGDVFGINDWTRT